VGCDYELVVIDNSENKYSIFEAYNLGIERSKGGYLCFVHDDILFHTENWGQIVENIFESDTTIGLLGIAGAKSKTKMPSAWWDCLGDQIAISIIQHSKIKGKEIEKLIYGFEEGITEVEVVFIDGVFMAMRKDNRIRFNNFITGFHNYDLNISLEYKKYNYKILVTNKILIEHFSIGNINQEWITSAFEFHNIYKNSLPLKTTTRYLTEEMEFSNGKKFIDNCLKYNNYKIACSVWRKLFCLHPISNYHIKFWKVVLIEKLKNRKYKLF
jgi:glycosyltransferase involved in cell wall biosynthesis